jgi:hypothetical protein
MYNAERKEVKLYRKEKLERGIFGLVSYTKGGRKTKDFFRKHERGRKREEGEGLVWLYGRDFQN